MARYLVIGIGVSGIGAVNYLVNTNNEVYVWDRCRKRVYEMLINKIIPNNVVIMDIWSKRRLAGVNVAVISPGVVLSKKQLRMLKQLDIDIVSELDLGATSTKADIIAVTGTNGKTTTSKLIKEVLSTKYTTHLVGNIGVSFCSEVMSIMPEDKVVVEASSFQLENTRKMKPKCVAILNIAQDHLDRYKNMDMYISAKRRILDNVDNNTLVILNNDDMVVKNMASGCDGQIRYISVNTPSEEGYCGAWVDKGMVHYRDATKQISIDIGDSKWRGKHNYYNVMVAVIVALWYNVDVMEISKAFSKFDIPRHRMQEVGIVKGVRYINDSKATNTHASMAGIRSVEENIILLLGGSSKREKVDNFLENLPNNVKYIITFGQMGKKLYAKLAKLGKIRVERQVCLADAYYRAKEIAQCGEVVLLSPAFASFDEFDSYEERGEFFEHLVKGD